MVIDYLRCFFVVEEENEDLNFNNDFLGTSEESLIVCLMWCEMKLCLYVILNIYIYKRIWVNINR